MLKTGKSYTVKVLDHFSSSRSKRSEPLFFSFVGKYVRAYDIYCVFEISKDVSTEGNFVLPLTEDDKYMYCIMGKFKAVPYSG